MILTAEKIIKIVVAKPRSYLLVGNLTNSDVYISKNEHTDKENFIRNGFCIQLNGLVELNPCVYQGDFYAYSATASDLRILQL